MASARPRPRPKPKQVASSSSNEPKDEDSLFLKNKSRSVNTWKKLDDISKKTRARPIVVDSDEELSPRSKRKKKAEEVHVPDWQRGKALRMLSEDRSSEEDGESDGIEILDESSNGAHPSKRKRQEPRKSRSRSLTPPPQLPATTLQAARNVVRQTLRGTDNTRTREDEDDDEVEITSETIYSNPELAQIAKTAASQAQSQSNRWQSEEPDISDTVQITVNWQPHPLNANGKPQKFVFKTARNDNLRELFDATAEDTSVLEENLVITYRNRRIYSSVTPAGLHIYSTADFYACDKTTYDYVKKHGLESMDGSGSIQPVSETNDALDSDAENDSDAAEDEGDGETFSLVLRSSSTKDVTLTVRQTTKCGAIVKAFLKKAGLAGQYGASPSKRGKGRKSAQMPQLSVDGDRMGDDVEIGEADLEDGDVVEVVGL